MHGWTDASQLYSIHGILLAFLSISLPFLKIINLKRSFITFALNSLKFYLKTFCLCFFGFKYSICFFSTV